jgi:hypothetical protein
LKSTDYGLCCEHAGQGGRPLARAALTAGLAAAAGSGERKRKIMPIAIGGVTFDARDAGAAAAFWAAALGRSVASGAGEARAAVEADPAIPGSRIVFLQVPEGKTVKNRMHFDLVTGDLDAEVLRLTGLGATRLGETNGGIHYVTLADPEGNEFDLIAR